MKIRVIDHKLHEQANNLLQLQIAAYRVEAELIGAPSLPPLEETVESILEADYAYHGYYEEDQLLGFIAYKIEGISAKKADSLEVHKLVVDPQHFRKGIGQTLLDRVVGIAEMESISKIRVATGRDNLPAVRLYETNGFECVDTKMVDQGIWINEFMRAMANQDKEHPIATIEMASGAIIQIEIYPEAAPNTANSFIGLANRGLFDNREIGRIVPGFVIQPSYTSFDNDPECKLTLDGEFRENGFENHLVLSKYAVAMGGDGAKTASGSCFYIAIGNQEPRLDGKYPGFGRIVSGFEELKRLEEVETTSVETDMPGVVVNKPKSPEVMKTIRVDTFGKVYPAPKALELEK